MNVLFINRSYWPDAEATGQLLTELCEDIGSDEAISVSIICGQPNFNLEEAHFKAFGTSRRNDVTIHRVRHSRFDKSTFWGRVTNFITFLIAATWKALWCERPDVIIVETDPPLLCLLGYMVSRIRRVKLVCYLQDIYPDIAIKLGRLKYNWFTRLLRSSFLFVYRRSDQIVVVGSDMKRWLINHLVKPDRIRIIENWVDTDRVYPFGRQANPFRAHYHLTNKFVAMYSGNLGYTQRFDMVLDAAEQFRDNENVVFVFVGNGVKRKELSEEIIKRKLPNVRLIDYQSKSRLALSLSAADVHFVLLDGKLTELMMPSKIYSALASGSAILGLGRSKTRLGDQEFASQLSEIIESNNAGYFIDETKPGMLAEKLRFMLSDPEAVRRMGDNARAAAVQEHCRSVSVRAFKQLFVDLGHLEQISEPPKRQVPIPHIHVPQKKSNVPAFDKRIAPANKAS